jgi:hypothetical protein
MCTGSLGRQAEVGRCYAIGHSRNGMRNCIGLTWLKTGIRWRAVVNAVMNLRVV